MYEITGAVALFACDLFAGAAGHVSLVEHPARMESGLSLHAVRTILGLAATIVFLVGITRGGT